jgi:outer membrane receptor protein involved in Fe transport
MNHRHFFKILLSGLWIFMLPSIGSAGTAGKISGTISDGKTGAALPGANVVIEGTGFGSVTDGNGNFTILNVPPGMYSVRASYLGYVTMTIQNLQVHIDQTTKADAKLEMQALVGESVVVVAHRSIVKPDVATSVVAVTNQEIEELPVADVQSIVGLQAGIRGELEIRGGEASEALFQVNGLTLRDPRNNKPISNIALSSVKEVSVERGGFNAEYGQIRSGLINVVTKEGSTSSYFGTATIRYSPYAPKNFGISPFDANSMWLRPYTDPAVCWTGTKNGAWDQYTQSQNLEFAGWNEISRILNQDNDPNNDLTPLATQRRFLWETRKRPKVAPDYTVDAGFGGPVPFIGKTLGNLRFFGAYRRDREMLLVPLTRDDNLNWDGNLRLDSDISKSMKIRITALGGKLYTQARNWQEGAYIQTPDEVSQFGSEIPSNLWSTGYFSPVEIDHKALSARLTHFINQKTFYEIQIEHINRRYHVTAARERDLAKKFEIIPGYYVDEAPFGYSPEQTSGVTGLEFGGHTSKQRDFSKVSATTLRADLTSQMNFNNLVKTGLEFVYNNLDLDYGQIASLTWGKNYEDRVQKHIFPLRASVYLQDKLETKGFIANLGARLDYSNANTEWYNVDPYDPSFFSQLYSMAKTYNMKETKPQWQISPRLGISHPVTENSKLFFNYGHFKQMPSYQEAFRLGRGSNRKMTIFGNPDLILAKTVSYELGYDHSLFNDFLVQVAAFYHDIIDEQNQTAYISPSGVSYEKITSNNYKDIRGFELTLRKNRGRYWTAFGNYTYQVTTRGHFGTENLYQDPSEQKRENERTQNLYQERPMPSPYARANVTFYTPPEFGPQLAYSRPFGDLMLSLIFDWESGEWSTFNPQNPLIAYNVQRKDVFDTQLRFVKSFKVKKFNFQLFVDVYNALNHKQMSLNSFGGRAGDYENYMNSLHLPRSTAYSNIPGDDQIGEYRREGIDYQPVFGRGSIDLNNDKGVPGEVYYDFASGKYMEDSDGNKNWREVDTSRIDRILKTKAYIDMPNKTSFTFLNPRQIFFGMRITFELN